LELFLVQVFNGLAEGMIYALVTLGLSMVYGVLRILHVAHAGVYTVGAYLGLWVYSLSGSLILALSVSMGLCALLGVAIERFVYYPLLRYPPYVPLIGGIAVYLSIEELCRLAAGPYVISFPAALPFKALRLGAFYVTPSQQMIVICTLLVLFLQWFLVSRTEIGLAMRCVAQDMDMASAMGMDSKMVVSLTFALGSAAAALAGVLVGIHHNQVYPTMGSVPAYKSLAIIVLGGLGSVPGAVLASLLIGVVESLTIGYGFPLPRDALAFMAMIAIFMARPGGLAGR